MFKIRKTESTICKIELVEETINRILGLGKEITDKKIIREQTNEGWIIPTKVEIFYR